MTPVAGLKNNVIRNDMLLNNTKWIPPLGALEYVVQAGGGSGGGGQYSFSQRGGGGGAGGFRSNREGMNSGRATSAEAGLYIYAGTNYTVTVGAGGTFLGSGSNSTFHTFTAIGGGKGGGHEAASNGGCGGGSGYRSDNQFMGATLGTAGQGFGTTFASDKSGGAGTGSTNSGYTGGSGTISNIRGSNEAFGGGGGAGGTNSGGVDGGGDGSDNWNTHGRPGAANRGAGGGGGSGADGANQSALGGNGGSGVVILRYPDNVTMTGGAGLSFSTSTSVAGFKITTFTSGTGTVNFS
jgi:hypothetical protein